MLDYNNLNMSETEYRNDPAVSYSLLKDLDTIGPSVLVMDSIKKESQAFDFGNLVDDLLTDSKDIENKYFMGEITKPTGQQLELADEVINTFFSSIQMSKHAILEIADRMKLFGSTKNIEKRIAQFDNEVFWSYLEVMDANRGKIVLDRVSYNNALELVGTFKTHPFTKDIFKEDDREKVYQLKLFAEIYGVNTKGMLDLVTINFKDKTIQPIDIKTGENWPGSFPFNFIRNKYYLQGGLYSRLLFINYPDFKILPFIFIYGSSKMTSYPLLWRMSHKWEYAAWEGVENKFKGLTQLYDDYKWYQNNLIFDMKREYYQANGLLEIPFTYDDQPE